MRPMKKTTNSNDKEKDRLVDLLIDALGTKAHKKLLILQKHRIETLEQFAGAIMPVIPVNTEKEIKQRQFACSLKDLQKIKSDAHLIKKISKTLQISEKEAVRVFARLKNVKRKYQSYNFNFKFGFGAKPKQDFRRSERSLKLIRQQGNASEFYVVPNYHHAGNVFDQGNRGTCVANAMVSLLDYKTKNRYSRQQVYHNAKCIDNSIEEEGTYIEIPFQLLKLGEFVDYGFVKEDVCPYNPEKGNTTHQGPLPEKVYNTKRVFSEEYVEIQNENIITTIINSLNRVHKGKACPVVIGVPLFESFFSFETKRTGLTTMPLPGEQTIGNHAMLIVGYDKKRRLFLVRNSWSPAFASENDKGYVGHAWIPFEYIEMYCFSAATVVEVSEAHVYVRPEDRLSSVYLYAEKGFSKIAAFWGLENANNKASQKDKYAILTKIIKKEKRARLENRIKFVYKAAIILLVVKVFDSQLQSVISNLWFQTKLYLSINDFLARIKDLL